MAHSQEQMARGRAADIFSLACVFLDMLTVSRGLSQSYFAKWREAKNPNQIYAFHANLAILPTWLNRICDPKRYSYREEETWGLKVVKAAILAMLSEDQTKRPLATQLYFGPSWTGACCEHSAPTAAHNTQIPTISFEQADPQANDAASTTTEDTDVENIDSEPTSPVHEPVSTIDGMLAPPIEESTGGPIRRNLSTPTMSRSPRFVSTPTVSGESARLLQPPRRRAFEI